VRFGLPLVADVAGIVVEVATVTGWHAHPSDPRLIGFEVSDPDPATRARWAGARYRPAPGGVWQKLWLSPPRPPHPHSTTTRHPRIDLAGPG
jgi:hypothetical protein